MTTNPPPLTGVRLLHLSTTRRGVGRPKKYIIPKQSPIHDKEYPRNLLVTRVIPRRVRIRSWYFLLGGWAGELGSAWLPRLSILSCEAGFLEITFTDVVGQLVIIIIIIIIIKKALPSSHSQPHGQQERERAFDRRTKLLTTSTL
ncbi:hypothetical protein QR685DRAFT_521394 [Neurospora intermedia]|uniref:Uncharacterized protein n=1 Tax=Neurospora intermedia TaxID=5142 RepID=A0ABR3DKC6_NEUIN